MHIHYTIIRRDRQLSPFFLLPNPTQRSSQTFLDTGRTHTVKESYAPQTNYVKT